MNASVSAEPSIEILVACMNRREPPPVLARFGSGDEKPPLLVINQCTAIDPPADLEEPGVRMISFREVGLSRSRNRALALARGDLLAFCDEDVQWLPSAPAALRKAFAASPGSDIITFQFLARETGRPLKSYRRRGFEHGALSIASVSAIEIAFRRQTAGTIPLDERFGLGTPIGAGEENVWLADARRRGLRLRYEPEPLCDHPGLSTGLRPWTEDAARARGATLRRMYPRGWPFLLAGLAVAKYRRYRSAMGPGRFVSRALEGAGLMG